MTFLRSPIEGAQERHRQANFMPSLTELDQLASEGGVDCGINSNRFISDKRKKEGRLERKRYGRKMSNTGDRSSPTNGLILSKKDRTINQTSELNTRMNLRV
jgi:hypothetical protein